MRTLTSLLIAGALGLSCALLVGCGDRNRLLPADVAGRLDSDLASVAGAVQSGDCPQTSSALRAAVADANRIPAEVDSKLHSRINEGLSRLTRIAPEECSQATTQTETTPTDTTETTTEPTTTEPTTQTTQTTAPTTTEPTTTATTPTGGGGTPPGQAKKDAGG